jgi:hypothetical protein
VAAVGGALTWRYARVISDFLWQGRAFNPLQRWDSPEQMAGAAKTFGIAVMIIDGVLAVVFLATHT